MMKKITLLTYWLLFQTIITFGQKEDKFWFWGSPTSSSIGTTSVGLEFYTGNNDPQVLTGTDLPNLPTDFGTEGTFVANDPVTGDFIFLTDGKYIIDVNFNTVAGSQLSASPSSTQPVVACPLAQCPFDQYYIFTNPTGCCSPEIAGPLGITLYNTTSNTYSAPITIGNNIKEGLVVIEDQTNPYRYWIMVCEYDQTNVNGVDLNKFVVYQVDQNTMSPADVQVHSEFYLENTSMQGRTISQFTYTSENVNQPNTVRVAYMDDGENEAYSFLFNTSTGLTQTGANDVVSTDDYITIDESSLGGILYDIEFSPNGQFLYLTSYFNSELHQYDFNTGNVVEIEDFGHFRGGGLEIGPDGFVYHVIAANTASSNSIGRIITPDVVYNGNLATFYEVLPSGSVGNQHGYNLPEFITTPAWGAEINLEGPSEICEGQSVTLSTTVESLGEIIASYTWFKDNVLISGANNPFYTVTEPGVYEVVVEFVSGCSVVANKTITVIDDHCLCLKNQANSTYDEDVTLTTAVHWDGDVSIGDGVTVTVDGTSLDATNVDVILGSCAKIKLINGASLRANNSVFRTCDETDAWAGIEFSASTDNRINECTFKNAAKALSFSSLSEANVHSSLFSNCYYGIYSKNNTEFNASVTGNQFVVDNNYPSSGCGMSTNTYFVYSSGTDFKGLISGNEVKDVSDIANVYRGIYINTTLSANIIDNTIVDATSSGIYVRSNNSVDGLGLVSNNTITNPNNPNGNGIYCSRFYNLEVSNNIIISYESSDYGIYSYFLNRSKVKGNIIKNYNVGIKTYSLNNSQVIENEIESCNDYGIYLNLSNHTNVSCNEIDMDKFTGELNEGVGVYYYVNNLYSNNSINSNCIKNSVNAMYMNGYGSDAILPEIRNNFLYNYGVYGIYSQNFTGNIGASSLPGMNTFYSNSTAEDVYSNNGTITLYDNFSLGSYNYPNVQVASNTEVYSTAACAGTIFGVNNQANWSADLICDDESFMTEVESSNRVAVERTDVEESGPLEYYESGRIVELNESRFNIFPNPAQDELSVYFVNDLEEFSGSITIHSIDGLEVESKSIDVIAGYLSLDISLLASGVYHVSLKNSDGEILETNKFFKVN